MDPDEPLIGAAAVENTVASVSSTRSNPHDVDNTGASSTDSAKPVEAYEDDDDDDGPASVGRPAIDDDEAGAPDVTTDSTTTTELASQPQTSSVDTNANGESVEAIEAAVASLALQQQSPRLRQHPSQTATEPAEAPRGDSTDDAGFPTPAQLRPAEAFSSANDATAAEPSTSGADDESTPWHAFPKHFFILSSAGKPIYSYNGDEKSLVGLSALISALVSVVHSQGDAVQHIRSGSTLIVFMLRGPLYFVAMSSVGEPATALRKQLELLYGQLVLVVTTGLERIIQRNPAYDVRSLLDGVGGVLSSLISLLSTDASYLQCAYKPLPVPASDRAAITDVLGEAVRQSGAVYGLLMADTYVVALSRARQQPALHPDDLLLLANFVMCNNAYRHGHGEAFSPVCLPHYNSDAFLHAYIHYLDASSGLYLVLLSGSAEAFHQLSAARVWLEEQVTARGLMPRLKLLRPPEHAGAAVAGAGAAAGRNTSPQQLNVLSVENLPRPLGGRFGHTPVWSYIVRFQTYQQAIFSPPGPLHRAPAGAARLAAAYTQLYSLLHTPAAPGRPNKMAWFADSHAVLVAARDRELELYLVCDPLTEKTTALGLLEAMKRHFSDRGIAADVVLPSTA